MIEHAPAVHTGTAWATGVAHWLPHAPQLPTSICTSRQALLHRVKPALHVKSQAYEVPVVAQVATPLRGEPHGEQEVPQVSMLLSLAHVADAPTPHV